LLRVAAFLGKFLVGLALALAVFLAGTYFHVRGALPSYSGTMDVAGLKAPVEILRDKNAIPHIIAGSIEDAAFGSGLRARPGPLLADGADAPASARGGMAELVPAAIRRQRARRHRPHHARARALPPPRPTA
jgi:hypothetical protein